jgi:nucleotidyltransferase substrate binding protein (TIGR01987 family)
MKKQDIRWVQRFQNFELALKQLDDSVVLSQQRPLSLLEEQGVIKTFEFTYELGWNVLKDYLEYQGIVGIIGSRDAIREAFQKGLISQGQLWMDMSQDRNKSAHTYNKIVADDLFVNIKSRYLDAFKALQNKMKTFVGV